ncbi:hypothetical protein [Terrabacter carboxydivorans]|uniref:hypothetical protein n=1 Tax=Terrabacter carboxydivorans TaxID=619730 RepID=UPI0031D889E7
MGPRIQALGFRADLATADAAGPLFSFELMDTPATRHTGSAARHAAGNAVEGTPALMEGLGA